MSYVAYIIQRKPKHARLFVELEKSTEKLYFTREDAEADRQSDPILAEFFAVYEVEVEFSYGQIEILKADHPNRRGLDHETD
jgi:hypothetical protein